MVRWNIQEVPISFNLLDMPNMGAARVLQNAPNGYMVFIEGTSRKISLSSSCRNSERERRYKRWNNGGIGSTWI